MILTSVMTWTQADADAVRAAVLALATGARVASVSLAAFGRTVQYVATDLPQLRALLAEIDRALSPASRFSHASFSKGFSRG